MDSLLDTSSLDQTAQEEHRVATKANWVLQMNQSLHRFLGARKTHPLPTTNEYILHEYADVFKGVGTLLGGPYHIKLKITLTNQFNTHQDEYH